ncbi:MAG: glycosyltransferase family 4 protein [Legionellaceae bacterium]|nr:glycosyltransferase family 4 protein [Legionellaceae bacterium]
MAFLLLAVFILTWVLTWGLRRYALAKHVLDIPNSRSAHTEPTPRGGGLGFVAAVLLVVPYLGYLGFLVPSGSLALVCGGVFIASLGFLDDHGHVGSAWRLLGHVVAAVAALYWVGGLPPLEVLDWTLNPNVFSQGLALFYLVWLLNLYNFMDGIDGLAGIEALSVCVGMAILYGLTGDLGLLVVPLILAAGALGFLCWNFPVARIFMGDAGSGFLGFIFGVLSVQAAHVNPAFFWSWLILLGVFIVDASVTLIWRGLHGEKIYQAHDTHAYQHASRRVGRHDVVTLGVLLINSLWLFPLAVCVALDYLPGFFGVILAYIPLILLAFTLKAGRTV